MSPIQNKPGPFRALRGPFGHCHLPTSETCIGLFPSTLPQGRFSTGSHGFSEMRYLRLGAQKASLQAHGAVTPGVAWPAGSRSSPLSAFPSPQVPLLVAACASAALVLRCGSPDQGWVSAAQFRFLFLPSLLRIALEVYRVGVGCPGA